MDLYWHGDLNSPKQPGIYRVPGRHDLILVRQKDIDDSQRLDGKEIRCSCVRNIDDHDGSPIFSIYRMVPRELEPGGTDRRTTTRDDGLGDFSLDPS
jgi:hypothetical protein